MRKEVLKLENITKYFDTADGKLEILKDINLSVYSSQSVSIVGKSGSGKSTLLSIAALIDKPSSGEVYYNDSRCVSLNDNQLSKLRASSMGFVFQNSLLLEDFSALENVMFPLLNIGVGKKEAEERAKDILASLGLEKRLNHRPKALSGGEKQRTAIARALVNSPDVIFADEPTGALDEESAALIENLLLRTCVDSKAALVLVTHNPDFASHCEARYVLEHKGLYLL